MYSKFSFSLLDLIYRVLIKPKNNNNNKFDIDFSLRVLTYQKRQNFTCSGAQNHATENRGIGRSDCDVISGHPVSQQAKNTVWACGQGIIQCLLVIRHPSVRPSVRPSGGLEYNFLIKHIRRVAFSPSYRDLVFGKRNKSPLHLVSSCSAFSKAKTAVSLRSSLLSLSLLF